MKEEDIQKLKDISKNLKRLNVKIKLIGLLSRAKAEYESNKYSDCMQTCKDALKTDPNNAVALRGLGCVMQSMGNDKKALDYYHKALDYSKNKEIEYTLIGTIYYNEDNYEQAIKYYNLAIDENDNYDLAYEGRNQSMLEYHVEILDMQDSLIKGKMFK